MAHHDGHDRFPSRAVAHVNRSDSINLFHGGGPLRYLLFDAASHELRELVLGPDPARGHVQSFTCPAGWWKAAQLEPDAAYCLLSVLVCPGFDYADHRFVADAELSALDPELAQRLRAFLRWA